MRKNILIVYISCVVIFCVLLAICTAQNKSRHRQAFIQSMLSDAQRSNRIIKTERARINSLYHEYIYRKTLSRYNIIWLRKLSDYYGIKNFNLANQSVWRKLLRRVDIIPPSLIIAQAAYESDWGRSRFAREGHNYFGQRCTGSGCGMIPKGRAKNAIYKVRKFPDVISSVRSYIHNLNTNSAYEKLRKIREQQREKHRQVQGAILAQGLLRYSEQREYYILAIRKIIKYYGLWKYDVK